MAPSVWVVMLTYNDTADLLEGLDSLQGQSQKIEVVVVNNGSKVDPKAQILTHYPAAHYIDAGGNLGFAAGNNLGLRYALDRGADYLLVLNPDVDLPPDTIRRLVETAEREPNLGMLGPVIVSYHDHSKRYLPTIDWHNGVGGEWPLDPAENALRDVDFVNGCALLVKASIARQIGLFDPIYFIYYEDTDWSLRCKRAGYRLAMDAGVPIYHKGTPDRARQKSSFTWYYYLRNQSLFFKRYGRPDRRQAIQARHDRDCLNNFKTAMQAGEEEKADAILSGWLAGRLGRYGAGRWHLPQPVLRLTARLLK